MNRFVLPQTGIGIRLGRELGRGSEAAVFEVAGRLDWVAKIYFRPPGQQMVRKLSAMAAVADPYLQRVAAWPLELVLGPKGGVCGFVMPRIGADCDIRELYSPKRRIEAFPDADFPFLIHVGANLARVFATVHGLGHVIGDVNGGNVLVGPEGDVALIDCDSFQVAVDINVFTCDVGTPLFTPPELSEQTLTGLVRSPNHDLFGLAVLLFHLLFLGRHPFSGRYAGPGDMPIEKAIAEYRFAYGPDRQTHGMDRPPATPPLATMGDAIASNFIRAFARSGSVEGRPDARSWIAALEGLEASLCGCPSACWHHYPRDLAACPWCSVEAEVPGRLFGLPIAAGLQDTRDVPALWQAIVDVPGPGDEPPLPSEGPQQAPKHLLGYVNWRADLPIGAFALALVGGLACYGYFFDAGFVDSSLVAGVSLTLTIRAVQFWLRYLDKRFTDAENAWLDAVDQWRRQASASEFAERRKRLALACQELIDLPKERRRRLATLEGERERRQRKHFLDEMRVDRAELVSLRPSVAAMLASHGIETAADVDRHILDPVPGLSDILKQKLVEWRIRHERKFRFDPGKPVDRRDIAELDRELEARRRDLLATLSEGPAELDRCRRSIIEARDRLMPWLKQLWSRVQQARRDWSHD